MRRLAMIFEALSSPLRTSTYTWEPYLVRSAKHMSDGSQILCIEDIHVASSAAESPPPMTAKGLFLRWNSVVEGWLNYFIDGPKDGDSTIADGACTDTALPIRLLSLEA